MLPLFLVLGATGALLEIKRLLDRPPRDDDYIRLQQSEDQLRRVLQDVQRELQQEKSEHERDQSKIDELEQADLELRRVHADVLVRKEREVQQRTLEYRQLSEKIEDMQVLHEEENRLRALKFEAEVEVLKTDIASAFARFSDGKIGARDLLENVSEMGVDVQLTAEELENAISSAAAITNGRREVKQLQLQIDSEWRSQLRLLSDDPERMARQLAAGAHRTALPATSSLSGGFPTVRTPKERREINIFSHAPALPLPAFTSSAAVNKENAPGSSRRDSLPEPPKDPLQAANTSKNHAAATMIPIESKKAASPVKSKKRASVPRLGLAVAMKAPSAESNREVFALGDFSSDNDEHRMLNRSIM